MPQISLFTVDKEGHALYRKCSSCILANNRFLKTNCMQGMGSPGVDLMFIGKAPNEEDDQVGYPMTGKGGTLFQELLNEAGFRLDEVYIDNCIKCFPGKEPLKDKYWEACSGHLLETINKIRPKALVSVGAESLRWLTGYSGVKKYRKRGIPFKFNHDLLVYPIGQPAQIFHAQSPAAKKRIRQEIMEDLYWLKGKSRTGTLTRSGDIPTDYKMVNTIAEFEEVMEELEQFNVLSCDLETARSDYSGGALFPDNSGVVTCIGFSGRPGHGRAIPLYALGVTTLYFWKDEDLQGIIIPRLREFLQKKTFFGQNFVQFDQKWIAHTFGVSNMKLDFDTMYGAYLMDEEGSCGLEEITHLYTSMPPWKKTTSYRDIVKQCKYLCIDVDATFRVRMALEEEFNKNQKFRNLMHQLLLPLGQELNRMELKGVFIDPEALNALDTELSTKLDTEISFVRSLPEVRQFEQVENTTLSVTSPDHLATVMQHYLKLPCVKKTGNQSYSTDREVLEHYQDEPFVASIQNIRRLQKLKGTYCDGIRDRLDLNHVIHTSYLVHGTVTGRPASQNPNLMNIPREATAGKALDDGRAVKRMFKARKGYCLLQADYSQIELRVLAMYSGDANLIGVYKRNEDLHRATAAETYGISLESVTEDMRDNAKPVNFGIIYGKTEEGIAEDFLAKFIAEQRKLGNEITDLLVQQLTAKASNLAKMFMDGHKRKYPDVWKWMREQEDAIRTWGFQETFSGRRRRYEDITQHAIRQAYNFPIQSYASDLCEQSIFNSAAALRALNVDAYPILTVYDSIIYEVLIDQFWEAADIIKMVMEGFKADHICVPLVAEFKAGPNWGDLKKVDFVNRALK